MDLANQLGEQARKTRAEYYRQWRAKNPDKVREKNRRYWENRAKKLQASEGRDSDAEKSV